MIIIPMKNGYFIGNINPTFSDKPILAGKSSLVSSLLSSASFGMMIQHEFYMCSHAMIETTNNIWCGIWAKDHGLSWVMWSICMYYIYTIYLCGCLFDYLCTVSISLFTLLKSCYKFWSREIGIKPSNTERSWLLHQQK